MFDLGGCTDLIFIYRNCRWLIESNISLKVLGLRQRVMTNVLGGEAFDNSYRLHRWSNITKEHRVVDSYLENDV